jgi:hypothetical protein
MLLIALIANAFDLRAEPTMPAAAGAVSAANSVYRVPAPIIEMRGRWYRGPVYSSAVSGDHVYFGTGGAIRVLKIEDAAKQDATSWKEVASIQSSGVVRGLDASDDYLYVADASGALRIIDISNPEKPREKGQIDLPDARAVAVEGPYAYLASGWSGLAIVDISDPGQPRLMQTQKNLGYLTDVHVTGSLALVVGHTGGLRLIDVASPLQPTQIGHYEIPGQSHGVYATDQRAYVVGLDTVEGDNAGGLTIFDISAPSEPKRLGFQPLVYGAERVWVEGSYAYLAGVANDAGLIIVDVSNPSAISGHPQNIA